MLSEVGAIATFNRNFNAIICSCYTSSIFIQYTPDKPFGLNSSDMNKDTKPKRKLLPGPASADLNRAEAVFIRGLIIECDAPFLVEAAGFSTVDKAVVSKRSRREKRLDII